LRADYLSRHYLVLQVTLLLQYKRSIVARSAAIFVLLVRNCMDTEFEVLTKRILFSRATLVQNGLGSSCLPERKPAIRFRVSSSDSLFLGFRVESLCASLLFLMVPTCLCALVLADFDVVLRVRWNLFWRMKFASCAWKSQSINVVPSLNLLFLFIGHVQSRAECSKQRPWCKQCIRMQYTALHDFELTSLEEQG